MQAELAHNTSLKEVEKFDKNALKNVDTVEKNPLPDQDGNSSHYNYTVGSDFIPNILKFGFKMVGLYIDRVPYFHQ